MSPAILKMQTGLTRKEMKKSRKVYQMSCCPVLIVRTWLAIKGTKKTVKERWEQGIYITRSPAFVLVGSKSH